MQFPKGNKYRAKKSRNLSGHLAGSGLERRRGDELILQQRGRIISGLEFQPKVQLRKYHTYKPDHFFFDEGGRRIYDDAKGAETERFKINCRLWKECGPGILRISKQTEKGFWIFKDIIPDKIDESMHEPRPEGRRIGGQNG
jgi:hypothetical protein